LTNVFDFKTKQNENVDAQDGVQTFKKIEVPITEPLGKESKHLSNDKQTANASSRLNNVSRSQMKGE